MTSRLFDELTGTLLKCSWLSVVHIVGTDSNTTLCHTVFIAYQHTDTRYWYSNTVCPSDRLSVRNVPVSDENGLTYCHSFYPNVTTLCSANGMAKVSVICLSVTFMHPTQTVKLFSNIFSPNGSPIIQALPASNIFTKFVRVHPLRER